MKKLCIPKTEIAAKRELTAGQKYNKPKENSLMAGALFYRRSVTPLPVKRKCRVQHELLRRRQENLEKENLRFQVLQFVLVEFESDWLPERILVMSTLAV